MSTFSLKKKIEILMTSDISTTENAENGGLGHIPYFIIHERLPTKFGSPFVKLRREPLV